MNRDDLHDEMNAAIFEGSPYCEWTPIDYERATEGALEALVNAGATHILMKDGTAVPLAGGEAVEGVVVLRTVDAGTLSVGQAVVSRLGSIIGKDSERVWSEVAYYDHTDTVYVPLNTPSKPNQEDSAVVALSESKEHEES